MENLMKERKEQLLAVMGEPSYVPMKQKELAMLLDVPKECREELVEVLDELVADGSRMSLFRQTRQGEPCTRTGCRSVWSHSVRIREPKAR